MSLVEKALRKMQSAPSAAAELSGNLPRRAPEPVIEKPAHHVPPPAVLPAHRTDKVVEFNHATLRTLGLLPTQAEERRFHAEYRQIKRPLIAAAKGRGMDPLPNGRAIMIASALPNEGKTFTSLNLALSMALEKDTSVLLVDGDIAKSHVSRTFGVKEEPGLMDLLLEESRDIGSVILPTTVPGLSLLPSGRDSATATESLASARMEQIVSELLSRDPTRIVLFDSPPLLLTTESRALAAVVGQTVVVVRAEETTHKAVLEALACLGERTSVGLVLNQCKTAPSQFYYGYGEYGQSSEAGADRQ